MFADHQALRVQVNDGDDAAAAGQFGRETHVAQADLEAGGLRARRWASGNRAKFKNSIAVELRDCVLQRQRWFRLEVHVRQVPDRKRGRGPAALPD